MTTLLALDASSTACSVALWQDGKVTGAFEYAPREHTRRLMPMIDDVLAEADVSLAELDALAYGRGPGSFTGIRIAAGTAQGLAYGLERPLIPVSTLQAMALGTHRQHGAQLVIPAFDARMSELYICAYRCENDQVTALMDEQVIAPEAFILPSACEGERFMGVGSGWMLASSLSQTIRDAVSRSLPEQEPDAADIVRLAAAMFAAGGGLAPHEAIPVYLRDKVTSRPK
ncbi:tRNA (adenosine(37)-N6)-threonylcarbamoyltransferase complex dimerization subunit type 1 TsaB [Phytohalomonas tamaricis]|uniref:tRNA (adenosine(37)-N6)-threonylcarbamoyltransferase complex dimerization subunit type 1 TsaB n=1 Tax=Phytohalomonas tamaricis TaxID=2081032 RepID=UPI000D0BE056|nr:tRNA (adenosine(37)-N6)-threonylcarbamoyltransferase complex dimerization subunit type 1 TsaB [Phytohalomonas tamaricis]